MDTSNAMRQIQELEQILTIKYGTYKEAIEIKTPALISKLKRIKSTSTKPLQVKKCISFDINCSILYPNELDLILQFDFPLGYPSHETCSVKAVSGDGVEYGDCSRDIQTYLESFVGFECVELVLEWINDNKDTCCIESNASDDNEGKVECYILRYNHLLSGPEHKKEKAMIDTAKKLKLQGGLLWGTPGVVVVVPPSTEEDAKEYASDCRSIGKRADGVESVWLPMSGVEEGGLGGLAQMKRGGKLQEMDTGKLREVCGGDEDLLRLVLNVH